MFGDIIVITTPLLKWYIQHSLVMTKIYQIIEYSPQRFLHFGEAVSDACRDGDRDKKKSIIVGGHR